MQLLLKPIKTPLLLLIPILISLFLLILAQSSLFESNPDLLAIGISFDFLITIPLIYYLIIRNSSISKITVLSVLLVGFVLATFSLPNEHQYFLETFKIWILPLIELLIFFYLLINIKKGISIYSSIHKQHSDFFTSIKTTLSQLLPKELGNIVATEIALFYYSFIVWKRRPISLHEYTYHKKSGSISLLAAFIFLILAETLIFHLLLTTWNSTIAWILSILSLYTGFQLIGQLKSMTHRPIVVKDGYLHLKYGIYSDASIQINHIDSVELVTSMKATTPKLTKLSFLGDLEKHNVIITLAKEAEISHLYGFRKRFKQIAFFVDDHVSFKKLIDSEMKTNIEIN